MLISAGRNDDVHARNGGRRSRENRRVRAHVSENFRQRSMYRSFR